MGVSQKHHKPGFNQLETETDNHCRLNTSAVVILLKSCEEFKSVTTTSNPFLTAKGIWALINLWEKRFRARILK